MLSLLSKSATAIISHFSSADSLRFSGVEGRIEASTPLDGGLQGDAGGVVSAILPWIAW